MKFMKWYFIVQALTGTSLVVTIHGCGHQPSVSPTAKTMANKMSVRPHVESDFVWLGRIQSESLRDKCDVKPPLDCVFYSTFAQNKTLYVATWGEGYGYRTVAVALYRHKENSRLEQVFEKRGFQLDMDRPVSYYHPLPALTDDSKGRVRLVLKYSHEPRAQFVSMWPPSGL